MLKYTSLFTALLLVASPVVHATGESGESTTASAVVGNIFPHFNPDIGNRNSTALGSRMIAKAYKVFNNGHFASIDSVEYKYWANRGSGPNLESPNSDDHVLFDVSYSYKFNNSLGSYVQEKYREQGFKNDLVTSLTYQTWDVANKLWKKTERYLYKYDGIGKMTSSELQLWYDPLWITHQNSVLSYNSNDKVVSMNSQAYSVDFSYSGNNLVSVVDKVFSQGNWNYSERKSYTYTGTDVTEYVLETWDKASSTWQKAKKWDYTYDANKDVTETVEYIWGNNGWDYNVKSVYTYDNQHNMLTEVDKVWQAGTASFENSAKQAWAYNSFSQPEVITTYSWDGSKWVNSAGTDYQIFFYYETYDPNDVPYFADKESINIYPVPASSTINVDLGSGQVRNVHLSVVDMTGRVVYNAGNPGTNVQQVPVHNLPAGNYMLLVSADDKRYTKRIVVAH